MAGLRVGAALAAAGIVSAAASAQPPAWRGLDGTISAIEVAGEDLVEVGRYGESREGRPLRVITLGAGESPHAKPGIAIIAGLDGRHHTGSRVAASLAARLVDQHADLLERVTIYVLPAANPDGLARWRTERPRLPGPAGSRVPNDADDDRRIDEDGPLDLNGDGVITKMRVEDPGPDSGLTAEHVLDPDDPRIVRPAEDDETPTHALAVEGRDQDGDGSIAEDGPGGVDLDRNFPYRWEEHAEGVGAHPLSEPETRALADWMLARTNLYAVLFYTPKDTIVSAPAAGATDATGQVPIGILKDDKSVYDALSRAFKGATGQTGAPSGEARGSLQRWAYAHLGLASVSTPVWVRPDLMQSEQDSKAGGEQKDASEDAAENGDQSEVEPEPSPEQRAEAEYQALLDRGAPERIARFLTADEAERERMRAEVESMSEDEQRELMEKVQALPEDIRRRVMAVARGQPDPGAGGDDDQEASGERGSGGGKTPDSDRAKWLAYADERGEGFVEWQKVEHPELGSVEVGGFVPGFRINAPEDVRPRLVEEQAAFLDQLVAMMPRVRIEEPVVERLGDGLWRVTLRVRNEGELPTRMAMGVRAERIPPLRVWIDLPDERVVSGERRQNTASLAARGGTMDAQWMITGTPGEAVRIDVMSGVFGDRTVTVTLGEEQE